jgi:putative ABC transport system permease protein
MLGYGGRLFVRTATDPYSLMPSVTQWCAVLAPDQSLERAATLEDIRAGRLSPERVNAFVFSGFAGIALLIAVVGVGSVLAFSVSARTREFGVRLAVGSAPSQLLWRVVSEGIAIAAIGIAAGAGGGWASPGSPHGSSRVRRRQDRFHLRGGRPAVRHSPQMASCR